MAGKKVSADYASGKRRPSSEASDSNDERRRAGLAGSSRRAARLRPYFKVYYSHGLILYTVLLIKNVLVLMLKSEPFNELLWLDCYLPGRLLLSPRIPEVSKLASILVCVYLVAHRLILRRLGLDFNLYCLDLVYYGHGLMMAANWWPTRLLVRAGHLAGRAKAKAEPEAGPGESLRSITRPFGSGWHPMLRDHFRSKLQPQLVLERPLKRMRLRRLIGGLHLFSLITSFWSHCFAILVAVLMLGPMFFTRRGFELSRKECVRFIVNEAAAAGASNSSQLKTGYEFIYGLDPARNQLDQIFANEPHPLILDYVDLVPFNWYHAARIACDIGENVAIIFGIGIGYWFQLYLTHASTAKSIVYARHLRRQLEQLARKLRQDNCEREQRVQGYHNHNQQQQRLRAMQLVSQTQWQHWRQFQAARHEHTDANINGHSRPDIEVGRLQASILDYFELIALFSASTGLSTLANIFTWLFYTLAIFVRVLRVDRLQTVAALDHGVQVELVALFVVCFIVMLLMLAAASLLESESRHLYKGMATAMALDQHIDLASLDTRRRWVMLLKHFEPKKLYCFTILNHTALSWLFCLKLFSWVISALVILKSM